MLFSLFRTVFHAKIHQPRVYMKLEDMGSEGEEEEGICCFLFAGNRWENDIVRQKAKKENCNSRGKKPKNQPNKKKQTKKKRKKQTNKKPTLKKGKRNSIVQAGLYRYHPAICIQPPRSRDLKAHLRVPAFFLFPGEGICSAEDRWHCHCLCSCGGFFQMGSWKLLCAAPAFLCSSPRVLGAPPACVPRSSAAGKIAAEPVRKMNGFISRVFFLFEVSLLNSSFL